MNIAVMVPPEAAKSAAPVAPLSCPVCGGREFTPMFSGRRATAHQTRSPYRITHSSRALVGAIERCESCGLAVLPQHLVRSDHYVEGVDDRFAEQADIRIRNAERLLRLLGAPPPGAALLDVGSAYGFLLAAAQRLGYRAVGVEPSQAAAAHARAAFGVEVFNGGIEAVALSTGSFDVIVLSDVIEHLRDPEAAIGHLHRLLRADGRLLILTPDVSSLVARALGRHWWALLDDHYFYFSRQTLPRFLGRLGFVVERLHSIGRVFPLSHWIFKLSQYHAGLYRALEGVVRKGGLTNVEVPVNLGDQMVCVARKR